MTLTSIDFQNYASRTIPEFDGSPSELVRFVDALELVAENVSIFEVTAVKHQNKIKGDRSFNNYGRKNNSGNNRVTKDKYKK